MGPPVSRPRSLVLSFRCPFSYLTLKMLAILCDNGHASAHPRYRAGYLLAPLRPPANKLLMKPWEMGYMPLSACTVP